ncbi:MAG: TatD family hydrolase [Candidatus Portnoybacteria bacterium]|nr:TatD family hydrolase [Candidatus Portnoybacteria bacterium]MDD4982789.1 TatD family hydrolase [Candidatus Portnoybacteria bacterium]
MLIDTHAHINFSAYKDDGDEVVRRALKENTWLINVGSERKTSQRAVEYAQKYGRGVFAAVGLHPGSLRAQEIETKVDDQETVNFKMEAEEFDYEHYKNLAQQDMVVAIGEIGLDYYRNIAKPELQKEVLLEQLGLAECLQKPVMLHCREAHDDLLKILKTWTMVGNKPLRGVIHSFSGRWNQAEQYLNMGFYLGFNGIITFARDYDRAVKEMPLERLLLETDCPYLTPEPFRGKRNEPSYVKYVAQKVAELRGISLEEVAEATTANAKKLFGI